MKFSCLVPVYNIEKEYLDKCIDSILAQTYKNFELIIVDDGSNKETADFCNTLKLKDDRIAVVHQENMGLAGARNTAISVATGDWFVHVDGDDWIEPEMLQKISEVASPECDIVFWGYQVTESQKTKKYLLKNKSLVKLPYAEIRTQILCGAMTTGTAFNDVALNTTWGKAFNADFVRRSNLQFDINLRRSQDVPYSLEAFYAAHNVAYIDEALYNYRQDNISLSRGYNEKTLERMTKTALACLKFANQHSEIPELKVASVAFVRNCFRNVVRNDFLNKDNPQSKKIKKKRFHEALKTEPYKSAFARNNLVRSGSLKDYIEVKIIAQGAFDSLIVYRKLRSVLRNTKKKYNSMCR